MFTQGKDIGTVERTWLTARSPRQVCSKLGSGMSPIIVSNIVSRGRHRLD